MSKQGKDKPMVDEPVAAHYRRKSYGGRVNTELDSGTEIGSRSSDDLPALLKSVSPPALHRLERLDRSASGTQLTRVVRSRRVDSLVRSAEELELLRAFVDSSNDAASISTAHGGAGSVFQASGANSMADDAVATDDNKQLQHNRQY